jgi:hypothetical protein
MGKLPATLFYWGDFVRDPDIRRCTHCEVGVWIRILCLMYEAEFKGVLATNGIPWTDGEIACAIGGDASDTIKCVTSLVTKGVASRNADGALINRRMYREHLERVATRKRVQEFRDRQSGNANVTPNVMPCTESEDESTTSSQEELHKEKPTRAQSAAEQEEEIYDAYPRKTARGAALKAIRGAVGRLVNGSVKNPAMGITEARRWLWKRASEYAASPAGQKVSSGDDWRPYPATWFNGERYFDDPIEWQRVGGNSNGKSGSNHQGAAVGRVQRTGTAWDAAIEQRLTGSTGDATTADVSSLPASGVRRGDNENLPDDLRGSSAEVRPIEPRERPANLFNPAKVFSPPGRSGRGA